jgi:hypothetical protein
MSTVYVRDKSRGDVWFTAAEISTLRGITVGYVRNLASTYQWRRTGTNPQRYHIHDVMDSLNRADC